MILSRHQSDSISGVEVHVLESHPDERGAFTELYRMEWDLPFHPKQWNVMHSGANVLRGVHVHPVHEDYLIQLSGSIKIGLKDLRGRSETFMATDMIEVSGNECRGVYIPRGVAHGFYFPVQSINVYTVSEYFNPDDELECAWNDPGLGIDWGISEPMLSQKDRDAGSLDTLLKKLETSVL